MRFIYILDIQSGTLLLTGFIVLIFLLWMFRPDKGGLALLSRLKMNSRRVQLEDALKFLFDCEYRDNVCDLDSIAGNLNISGDKAGRLLERLLTMGLVNISDHTISLTDTGRSYALRVIRIHRIWEKYLADETSVEQADWHNEADRLEHNVSIEDTEKLAVLMGNPVYDPHGDPIPSRGGRLPDPKGKSLSVLKEGELGRIIHIGMQVYVTDVSENKVTFAADGDECTLTPLFASHITVEILSDAVPVRYKYSLLSSLEIGEKGEIAGISPNCHGQQRRRLMDLGIVPGSLVSVVMKSASGDPTGYRVMGTTIGIRKKQAELIFIHKAKEEQNGRIK
jgi:DtxR family Mn-dependent transcriptional regulator